MCSAVIARSTQPEGDLVVAKDTVRDLRIDILL
jgi:hypothetical protein